MDHQYYSARLILRDDVCNESLMNATCDSLSIDGFVIESPELFPLCAIAALIGFSASYNIAKLQNAKGKLLYSLTFALFGIMMSEAFVNDSILSVHGNPDDLLHLIFGVIDGGLTSAVALTFAFDAFADIGWLQESGATFAVLGVLYAALFAGWVYTYINSVILGFLILYVYEIALCCGIYCVIELVLLVRSGSLRGIVWVVVAGIAGAVGLYAIVSSTFGYWLCTTFGCHFGSVFMWFFLTDVAMYCCYKYYMSRQTQATPDIEYRLIPMHDITTNRM